MCMQVQQHKSTINFLQHTLGGSLSDMAAARLACSSLIRRCAFFALPVTLSKHNDTL